MKAIVVIPANEATSTPVTNPEFHPGMLLPGSYDYLNVIYQNGGYALQVRNYVGLIPASNGYVIQIQPKVAISDLTYLLLRSGLLNHSLQTPFQSTVPYQVSTENLESFFEALALEFLKQIDKIRAFGLLRTACERTLDSASVQGRIDLAGSIKIYSKTYGTKMRQKIIERPFSNPENRLLVHCLRYLLNAPLRVISVKEVAKRLEYFGSLRYELATLLDLEGVRLTLERGRIPSTRVYYLPALNLALTILSGAGVTIGENPDVEFKPLVINTATMFEKYVRNLLQHKLDRTWVSVFDGRKQPRNFYSSGPNPISLKPDITFSIGAEVVLILDVKYKTEPTDSDHYQAWAYMEGFNVSNAVIVCADKMKCFTSEYSRKNKKLTVFGFDLSQIKSSEEELGKLITRILNIQTFT